MPTTLVRYQARRNTATAWTAGNEVLLAGEPGYESDTGKFKLGDGATGWNGLRYQLGGTDLNVRDFGAKMDGTTDDLPALRAALTAAGAGTAKTVRIPAGTLYAKFAAVVVPPAGVTIRGEGSGRTVILADAGTTGAYAEGFNLNNPDTLIEGVTIRRAADFPAVLIVPGATTNLTLRDVTLDGRRDLYTVNYCHGLQVGRHTGTTLGFTATGCTFTRLAYGLFQANASTGTVDGLTFTDCAFTGNTSTDLEFNAPASTMRRVRVTRCAFSGNLSTTASGGFAVGLAHVTDAIIRDCTVTAGYANEPFHLEDWCADITIVGCTVGGGGRQFGPSFVRIISGCTRVRITGNSVDNSGSAATGYTIDALAGGTGLTPGGRQSIAPFQLEIADNDFQITGGTLGIYLEVVLYATITNNRMNGPGTVDATTLAYAGGFSYAINCYYAFEAIITGNYIKGFTHAILPRSDGNQTFGPGTLVAHNVIEQCIVGIPITNVDACTVTGNIIRRSVNPMIAGHGSYSNGNAVITGNQATGNKWPMSLYGTVPVTTTGTAAVGTGATLTVQPLRNVIPDGTVITFPGGGTITTVGPANVNTGTLTGTVTGAAISSGETALAYIAWSYIPRTRTLANNSDDYYGQGGYGRRWVATATSYAIDGHEEVILATTAGITITLPPAAHQAGQGYTVKNTTTGTVTVAAVSGTVETTSLAAKATARYLSDGTAWLTV